MGKIKKSVAFIIYSKDRKKVLVVQRPPDDDLLPNVWGLPAGSLKSGESFEEAVLRSGLEKLGVNLEIVSFQNEGSIRRKKHTLYMKEFEVKIVEGKPNVPQKIKGVTQYIRWKWADPKELIESAKKGSLCSRLFLNKKGVNLT